jgi:hypothetical protein
MGRAAHQGHSAQSESEILGCRAALSQFLTPMPDPIADYRAYRETAEPCQAALPMERYASCQGDRSSGTTKPVTRGSQDEGRQSDHEVPPFLVESPLCAETGRLPGRRTSGGHVARSRIRLRAERLQSGWPPPAGGNDRLERGPRPGRTLEGTEGKLGRLDHPRRGRSDRCGRPHQRRAELEIDDHPAASCSNLPEGR